MHRSIDAWMDLQGEGHLFDILLAKAFLLLLPVELLGKVGLALLQGMQFDLSLPPAKTHNALILSPAAHTSYPKLSHQ